MSSQGYYKAVFFDLDDTLYPYSQYIESGIWAVRRYLSAVYGLNVSDVPISPSESGWEQILEYVCRQKLNSFDERLAYRLRHVFLTHIPDVQLMPEAQTAIALLQGIGTSIGVFAPGPAHAQRMKVRTLGLQNLCDLIMYPEDLTGHDALKDSIDIMCMALDVPLSRVLIIGNMSLTNFRPLLKSSASLLALPHPLPCAYSESLLLQNRLTSLESLLDLSRFLELKTPTPQKIPKFDEE